MVSLNVMESVCSSIKFIGLLLWCLLGIGKYYENSRVFISVAYIQASFIQSSSSEIISIRIKLKEIGTDYYFTFYKSNIHDQACEWKIHALFGYSMNYSNR